MNRTLTLNTVIHATAARLLPISLAIALTAAAHGQANYAGTQTLVTGLPNVQASGFTVDPAGNIYICDQYDNQLDEAVLTQSGYGPLTPILSGVCNQQAVSSPIAVDDAGDVFYFDPQANQLMRATKIAAGFGPPISVNGTSNNLSNPVGIAIDFYGDVYVADSGIGRVVEFPFNGSAYQPLQSVFNGLADLTGVTVDRARTVYITTGDGRYTGSIWKTQYDPFAQTYGTLTQLIHGFPSIDGIAIDNAGNLFISSMNTAAVDDMYNRAAIPNVWELSLNADGQTYSDPYPIGANLNAAQGLGIDRTGALYVMWVGGPRGSFTFDVDRLLPAQDVAFGSVAVGASAQQSIGFYVTGTELTYPTALVTTQSPTAKDFQTVGGLNCSPDPGLPFNTDGYPIYCSQTVSFSPTTSGAQRSGVALISGDNGAVIASVNLSGTGTGPQIVFDQGQQSILASNLTVNGNTTAVAVDGDGNLYYGSTGANSVIELPRTAGGFGAAIPIAVSTVGGASIAVDGLRNLYIADPSFRQLSKVPYIGGSGTGYGPATVLYTGDETFTPQQVAVDLLGNIFILIPNPGETANTDGSGLLLELPWNGSTYGAMEQLSSGELTLPWGMAVDANRNVFVTNDGSIIEYQYGRGGYQGYSVGTQTVVNGLSSPTGLAVDGNDNLYVEDSYHNLIQKAAWNGSSWQTPVTITTGINEGLELAADSQGNLFASSYADKTLIEINRSAPPVLTFATTAVGATSTDSPKTISVSNIGNQPLNLAALTYPTDFPSAGGDAIACVAPGSLTVGASCDLAVKFSPLSAGGKSESVTLTDNNLNVAGSQQAVSVNGAVTGSVPTGRIQLTLGTYTYTYPGTTLASVKVLPEPGATKAATGTVQLDINGANVLQTLTLAGAGNGNATAYFELPVLPAGTYTLQAVYGGDAKNPGGSSQPLQFTVAAAPVSITVACQGTTVVAGQFAQYPCKFYLSPIAASVNASLTLQLDNDSPFTIRFLNGVAQVNLPVSALGQHTLTVQYKAQGNYAASTLQTKTFTVVAPK